MLDLTLQKVTINIKIIENKKFNLTKINWKKII